MQMSKNVNNDVSMNPPIEFTVHRKPVGDILVDVNTLRPRVFFVFLRV